MATGMDLSGYVSTPEELPIDARVTTAAPVAIGVIGTYASAASIAVPAGTYKISANAYIVNGAVAAAFFNTKILVGAVAYAPTESSCIISGSVTLYTPEFVVNVPIGVTIDLQATGTQLGTITATTANGGGVVGATWLQVERIK